MKMKRILLLIIVSLCVEISIYASDENVIERLISNINKLTLQPKVGDVDKIKEFVNLSDSGRHNDAVILQLFMDVHLSKELVTRYIKTQKMDGSWPDINYDDPQNSAWSPAGHVSRIQSLSVSYRSPSSIYYNSQKLSVVIHKAMNYWFKASLRSSNWWYNEIGIPKTLGPAFLLMKDELSQTEKQEAIKVMSNAKISMTGQNKVWLSGNVFMKALLEQDIKTVRRARDSIVSEIKIGFEEGLQPDFSFHQHGPQLQFGNYGLSYISTMAYWIRVFEGTSMAVDTNQVQLLRDYLVNGIMWCVWRGHFDVSACARQVFKNSQKGKANALSVAVINMAVADSSNQCTYNSFLKENLFTPLSPNTLIGFNYFGRSDYGVMRTPEWFASVRMCSSRTIGYETTNNENLQGYFSADGAMMIMISGDEYTNIFPFWDWRHLPGVTNYDSSMPLPSDNAKIKRNKSNFVGGIAIDEKTGCTTMVLDRDGLYAQKGNFFINGIIVSLGAGITYLEPYSVSTTFNQTLLKGPVLIKDSSGDITTSENYWEGKNPRYIYHNKIGYIPIENSKIVVSNQIQSGSWKSIAGFYKEEQVSGGVFKAYIDHGISPLNGSYAYFILPNVSVEEVDSFYLRPTVNVVSNTTDCQAVSSVDNTLTEAIFYKPSKLKLLNGAVLEALDASIITILLDKNKKIVKVTAADPTRTLNEVRVRYCSGDDVEPELVVCSVVENQL